MITITGNQLLDWGSDTWDRKEGSWFHPSYARHVQYESIFSTLSGLVWDKDLYKLFEFGTRDPTSAVMRMMAKLVGKERVEFTATEYPEIDIQDTGLQSNYYDIIVVDNVLEHVDRPWLAANEVYRMTKPGGLCVIATPFMFPLHDCPVDCWRISPHAYGVLFPKDKWEHISLETWGNIKIIQWEAASKESRMFTGDWTHFSRMSEVPGASEPPDNCAIFVWFIGRKHVQSDN